MKIHMFILPRRYLFLLFALTGPATMKRNMIAAYEDMISNAVISQHCQADVWRDINQSHLSLLDHLLESSDIIELPENFSNEMRSILDNQSKDRRRCKIMIDFNRVIYRQVADKVCVESNYVTLEETPHSWIEGSPKPEIIASSAELAGIVNI